jgi:hypothetical protein
MILYKTNKRVAWTLKVLLLYYHTSLYEEIQTYSRLHETKKIYEQKLVLKKIVLPNLLVRFEEFYM